MKLLLDTHAALWWLADDARFSDTAARHLTDAANHVYLSAVVVWEVAIKRSLGKLEAPSDFRAILLRAGTLPLPIDLGHAAGVEALPLHHRDPFDRLLIVQAYREDAAVVTNDPAFAQYGVSTLW